jgi:hypothetical protein
LGPEKPRQDVDGKRKGLQPEKNNQQIRGPGHQHHANRGEEDEYIVLPVIESLPLHITDGHQHDQKSGRDKEEFEEEGVIVHDNHLVKAVLRLVPVGKDREKGKDEPRQGKIGDPLIQLLGESRYQQQTHGGDR